MRLLLIGDTHFTLTSPERRKDFYFKTQMRKFDEAVAIAVDYECSLILQSGDFFDSPLVSRTAEAALITKLRKFLEIPVVCTYGQHDISGHCAATYESSPLNVLAAANAINVVHNQQVYREGESGASVDIWGAAFGEEVPEIENKTAYFNVLIIHKMIGDKELWPGQELASPVAFLKNNPGFDLVLAGDYHYRFLQEYKGRWMINPGALMRKTISQRDLEHKPAVVVFDTLTKQAEVIELTVEPIEKVFDLTPEIKTDDSALMNFIESLKNSNSQLVGWKNILLDVMKKRKSSEGVRKQIEQAMSERKAG